MAEEEKQETISQEVEKERKNTLEKVFKVISIVLGIILIISLIILKINIPRFPLWLAILLIMAIIVMSAFIFFFFNILRRLDARKRSLKGAEELQQISIEECREIREKNLLHPQFADYLNGNIYEKTVIAGQENKVPIYVSVDKTYYENNLAYTFINMVNPKRNSVGFNLDGRTASVWISNLVESSKEPDVVETEESSDLLGLKRVERRISPQKKDKTDSKKKSEDLK